MNYNYLDHTPNLETFVELLHYRATHQPKQTAYIFLVDGETEAVSLSYIELEQQARAIASYLQTLYQPGERALLLYPPGLEYISAFFGCLYAGIVAVPAYPPKANRSLNRLQAIASDAAAKIALTTDSILSSLSANLGETPELETLHWLATDQITVDQNSLTPPNSHITKDTLAFLQYTSGSTGNPKGVMITHRNLLHNSRGIYQYFQHTPHSSVVSWLPMYHDMGLIGGVLQPLYGGFPAILMSPFMFLQRPIRWLEAISRYRATSSGGPNFAYDLCVRKITPKQRENLDLRSWDVAFNGAEPINAETLEHFAATFGHCGFRREAFYSCYGMAEATLMVSGSVKQDPPVYIQVVENDLGQNKITPIDHHHHRLVKEDLPVQTIVGCGHSLPDQKIVIVNPDTLTLCSEREVGEIWVSGESIAQGYWQNHEATRETFNAIPKEFGDRPFLRTGDLGFLVRGELFVTGRLKDLLIINGTNYYPQDIERTVEHSSDSIRPHSCAAFSVKLAGEERLVVVAEVERQYYKRSQTNLWRNQQHNSQTPLVTTREIQQTIRQVVLNEHDLQAYRVLLIKPGTIPKTSSGKIQRYACRAAFLNHSLNLIED
jgi:acyl-CoA synthetase (AMP-forming)/AMP-acid ligase II